jgi:hypothetical protein
MFAASSPEERAAIEKKPSLSWPRRLAPEPSPRPSDVWQRDECDDVVEQRAVSWGGAGPG